MKSLIKAAYATSAAAATALTLSVGLPGVANAAVARTSATPGCYAVSPNCVTPQLYGEHDQVLQVSFPYPNTPVIVAPQDDTSLRQDWTYLDVGTVKDYYNNGVHPTFGLTSYDAANYGWAQLYQLEWTPSGIPSNLCAANIHNHMVLRWCRGSKWQTYIAVGCRYETECERWGPSVGGIQPKMGFFFGLSVLQAYVIGRHNLATGSQSPDRPVYFTHVRLNSADQNWSS